MFARGSGQSLTEPEARTFRDNLTASIKGGTSFNFYGLGTEAQQGFKYEAIGVGGADWHHGVGAKVSGGEGMKYGSSVNSGVSELLSYLVDRSAKCRDALLVLGGYSQGAQVISEVYARMPGCPDARIHA